MKLRSVLLEKSTRVGSDHAWVSPAQALYNDHEYDLDYDQNTSLVSIHHKKSGNTKWFHVSRCMELELNKGTPKKAEKDGS